MQFLVFTLLCFLVAVKGAACNGNNEDYVKENLVGNWKEDQYKRTGLNDFLYEMGNFHLDGAERRWYLK